MQKIGFILLFLLWLPMLCYGETQEDMTKEILSDYTILYSDIFEHGMEELGLKESFTQLIPDFHIKETLTQLISGKLEISLPELLRMLVRKLLGEVYTSSKLMALVLTASILCSYLMGLKDGFGEKGVTQAAYYTCYLVIAGVSTTAFYDAAGCVSQAMENIALFMEMVVPVVITTLVASGAIVSASVFEPVLLTIVEVAVQVIQNLFMPLVMIGTAMNVANGISDKFKIQRLVKFINQCVKWGLSIMLTIFVATSGIQSIAASGADGLTVKLTKFAAANLIPVVGGILAESVETVMNCSVLIKNAVGVLGILCLLVIAVAPILKVAAILLIFRLTAAVAEPVSESKIITCLSELANSISMLFSMLAATTVMFVIVLTIVINAGSTALMLGR